MMVFVVVGGERICVDGGGRRGKRGSCTQSGERFIKGEDRLVVYQLSER